MKKLISHAEIPERDECIIRNMTKLNIQIFSEANKNVRKGQVAKKDRSADVKYQLSRFTPAVKDIMEVSLFTRRNHYKCAASKWTNNVQK